MSPRRLILCAVVLLGLTVAAQAANEPPVVAFQAKIPDSSGLSQRQETFPLVAIFPDRFVDLADMPGAPNLLKTHPGMKFTDIAPTGDVCGRIPVGLGPVEGAPAPPPGGEPGALPPPPAAPDYFMVVFSTAGTAIHVVTTPTGVPRPLPDANAPTRPATDPLDAVRQAAADQLRGTSDQVALQSYGTFDFNDDKQPEIVLLATLNGAPAGSPQLLIVATQSAFTFPIYSAQLERGSQVMGVGDVNGDGSPEIYIKTAEGTRDFGLEVYAWNWRGQTIERVFQRRSYGCF